MKKLTTLLVALMVMVAMFVACGQSEEPTVENKTSSQTAVTDSSEKEQPKETVENNEPAKSEDTTKVPAATEEKPTETTKPVEETKPAQTEQKNDQTAKTEEKPPFFMDYFDGQFVKCKLPPKWTGQEDMSQNVAAALFNATLKEGLTIQIVQNNKYSLEERAEGTRKTYNGTLENFSMGSYKYKRINFDQNGRAVTCLICIVGSNAYIFATDIFNDPGIVTILESLELK